VCVCVCACERACVHACTRVCMHTRVLAWIAARACVRGLTPSPLSTRVPVHVYPFLCAGTIRTPSSSSLARSSCGPSGHRESTHVALLRQVLPNSSSVSPQAPEVPLSTPQHALVPLSTPSFNAPSVPASAGECAGTSQTGTTCTPPQRTCCITSTAGARQRVSVRPS
jgi:hypothetical protein